MDHDVYNFLSRIRQRGIIEFDDLIKPLTRGYIIDKLIETDSLSLELTSLETDVLKYFLKDYNLELLLRDGKNKSVSNSVF